jgi:hypothetical protein
MANLGHRPDINRELGDGEHEIQLEQARNDQLAQEIRRSWWQRLGLRLKRHRTQGSDG